MRAVFGALREMVDQEPNIEVVYPVHLSPAVQEAANDLLGEIMIGSISLHLLDVLDFHNLASRKLLYHVGFRVGYKKKHHHWENRYWYCVIQQNAQKGSKQEL